MKFYIIPEKTDLNEYQISLWKGNGKEPVQLYRHQSQEPPTLDEINRQNATKADLKDPAAVIEEETEPDDYYDFLALESEMSHNTVLESRNFNGGVGQLNQNSMRSSHAERCQREEERR